MPGRECSASGSPRAGCHVSERHQRSARDHLAQQAVDARRYRFPPYKGIRLHAAPTQAGGASLGMAVGTLLGRETAGDSLDGSSPPYRRPTPCRCSCRICRASGAALGLNRAVSLPGWMGRRGPGELSRAVMEGVAFSARLAFEAVEATCRELRRRIYIGGGGARSDASVSDPRRASASAPPREARSSRHGRRRGHRRRRLRRHEPRSRPRPTGWSHSNGPSSRSRIPASTTTASSRSIRSSTPG